MTRASVLQKAGNAGQSRGKGHDKGYCLGKRQAMPVKALEKEMTRAITLRKGEALPVKALEKAMTRAIAFKRGRRCRSKPWTRQ